ncbi:hypothetical protein HCH54_005812 [Aspergillus fumigatus]
MPRISTRLVLNAYKENPLLPLLLRECRTLPSARNELRWLREKAIGIAMTRGRLGRSTTSSGWRSTLRSMCRERSKGLPLQYILGDQPFGDLEILCERGVLIPRPETESLTFQAATVILREFGGCRKLDGSITASSIRILDLCSGTGCISLLLHSLLSPYYDWVSVLGVDASSRAVDLARRNLHYNARLDHLSGRAIQEVQFLQGDVLRCKEDGHPDIYEILQEYSHLQAIELGQDENIRWDVLVSNPPYISAKSFQDGTTARSVRIFEPTIALVPPHWMHTSMFGLHEEDLFYQRLILLSFDLQVGLTVLECGDRLQAERVRNACNEIAVNRRAAHTLSVWVWSLDTGVAGDSPSSDQEPCAVFLYRQPQL